MLPSGKESMLALLVGGSIQSVSTTAGAKDSSHDLTFKEVHGVRDLM